MGIIPSGLCVVFTSFHSIFVGMFGPQENLLHLSLRRRFESSASYLVNTFLNRYEHVLLEKARNDDTAAELANKSGLKTLEAQIRRKTVRTTYKETLHSIFSICFLIILGRCTALWRLVCGIIQYLSWLVLSVVITLVPSSIKVCVLYCKFVLLYEPINTLSSQDKESDYQSLTVSAGNDSRLGIGGKKFIDGTATVLYVICNHFLFFLSFHLQLLDQLCKTPSRLVTICF